VAASERGGADQPDLEQVRGAFARGKRARHLLRGTIGVGLVLLAVGFAIGFAAGGVSVAATAVLLAGLFLTLAGAVAYRLVFWAEVYAKDRPSRGSRGPKP